MTNTPEQISRLASAIMDMAERDKGIVRSNLEELIFQHCAAADAEVHKPFVPEQHHFVRMDRSGKNVIEFNLEPGGLNYVSLTNSHAPIETFPFPPAPNMTATEVQERINSLMAGVSKFDDAWEKIAEEMADNIYDVITRRLTDP